MDDDYKSYFSYRLNPFGYSYDNKAGLLWASNNHSLFDKYLLYRSITSDILIKEEFNEDHDYLKGHFTYLNNYIDDPFLKNSLFFGYNNFTTQNSNEFELNIYDYFTQGEYHKAVSHSKNI